MDSSTVYIVKYYFVFLVKYKPLITRTIGGNDAPHKSVSCLDKTSTPDRVFNRKKSCWSSLHKTANIVPLEIKSATDSVCSSTMSSRSVSWSLSGPGDIRSYSFIRITNLCQIETRFDTISRNTRLTMTR